MKIFCTLLLCVAAFVRIATAASHPGWSLVWSDEFSQPDNSLPDQTKWTFDTGGGGFGNHELETYTTTNAHIVGGMLVIQALKGTGNSYTSSRMKTQGIRSWSYGRMEARIKIPRGQGLWPAFWMLGTNIASPGVGWPTCGEIDIMENIGREPTLVHGTIHGPGYSGANGIGGPCALPGSPNFADDFHVYAVEWTTNEMKWFVDNYQYFSASSGSNPAGTTWVYTQPQFILLNVAVGGDWPGNPDATTVFPQQMVVDYVRVYAATNLPDAKTNLLSNPGFESSNLTNWTTYGAGFNTLQETSANVSVHQDTNVFKVFGQFNNAINQSGVYQDIPATPGQTLTASGWIFTSDSDQIGSPNSAWIEVSFRDSTKANVLSLYRSTPFTNGTPYDLWLKFPVTNRLNPTTFVSLGSVSNLVAPANTSFVRVEAKFQQSGNIGGSVYFDDLKLTSDGVMTIPVPVAVARSGTNVNLAFPTYLNLPYQVNSKKLLSDTAWTVFTNLPGTGTNQSVSVNLQTSSRFFRVSRLCN